MGLKIGFELEGFFEKDGFISIPPKHYPTDGFPGLVEIRTPPRDLHEAYALLCIETLRFKDVDFLLSEFTFNAKQRAELRRRYEVKNAYDIQNIYGKYPRPLGNKTIASLQINISNLLSDERRDDKGVFHSARHGLFDMPRLIRDFDEEFAEEIREAKRQPGEYSVKDALRLEYRSLPNSVFEYSDLFLKRLERVLKGD